MRRTNSAFTLLEILVVLVIIGVLASVAMPSYNNHIERVRASEGVQSLTALLASQERYRLENGAYATDPTTLDIAVAASANFSAPTVANANPIASIQRVGGSYTLSISSAGAVTCASAPVTTCQNIGY